MSNNVVFLDPSKNAISTVFQGQQAGDDLSGGITGGYGLIKYKGKVWSITYQGQSLNLMRDDGDGARASIDVVILKASPRLAKTWYEQGYVEGSDAAPDCASANGVYPDQGVPKKQNDICHTCKRNAWNTAPGGGKGKACGDHRRMAVVPLADLDNEVYGGPMLLRCPAASLQDLAAFDTKYKAMGHPYFAIGIRIAFDVQESFPKFTFAAIRPLTDAEAQKVLTWRASDEVARVLAEGEIAPQGTLAAPVEAQPAFLEPQPVTPQAAQAQPRSPDPSPAPAAQPAPVSTGFGAASPQVTPQKANPVQDVSSQIGTSRSAAREPTAPLQAEVQTAAVPPKSEVKMTGFGAAAPAGSPPSGVPATPQGNGAAPTSPVVVEKFDASLDDRLAALLAAGNAGASTT